MATNAGTPPSAHLPPSALLGDLLQRLDGAQTVLRSLFAELLAADSVSAGEFLDALGLDALERYLPSLLRVRLMRMALQEGRAGRPFDDEALLSVVSPDMLVSHLPLSVLRETLKKLCAEPGDAEDLEPLSEGDEVSPAAPIESLDEGDEVTVAIGAEETDALLAQMPDLTLLERKRDDL
jgi:hypothetical protein